MCDDSGLLKIPDIVMNTSINKDIDIWKQVPVII